LLSNVLPNHNAITHKWGIRPNSESVMSSNPFSSITFRIQFLMRCTSIYGIPNTLNNRASSARINLQNLRKYSLLQSFCGHNSLLVKTSNMISLEFADFRVKIFSIHLGYWLFSLSNKGWHRYEQTMSLTNGVMLWERMSRTTSTTLPNRLRLGPKLPS